MVPRPPGAGNSSLLATDFGSSAVGGDGLDLLHDDTPWVYFVDNTEEASDFCFVAGLELQLLHKVFPLLLSKQRELVDVLAVAEVLHLQGVLL